MRTTYTGKWFALSIISLGIGGSFAFLIGMSRAPVISDYLPADFFQHALVGHVDLAILCWLLISAVVLWTRHLKGTPHTPSFWAAAGGVALIAVSALTASGPAVLNNYVPTIVSPVFFAGLGLFYAAFCVNVFAYITDAPSGLDSDDMTRNAMAAAAVIAVIMLVAVVTAFSLLGGDDYHPQVYFERIFWIPGHIQQILNGAMLVAVWYALLRITTGEEPKLWGFLKLANKTLVVSAAFMLALLFFFDPLDKPLKVGSEIIYAIGLGIPLFLHIANIFRQYRFQKNTPASVALLLSMVIYLFGIFIAYAGFNNDTRVPAHYHGAVTALTLALMAYGYHMLKDYKVRIQLPRVALIQPYIYGIGMVLFIFGLFISGMFGAPRKTFGTEWTDQPVVLAALSAMGLGTLLAVIGGVLFVLYVGLTLIKEEPDNG